MPVTSYSRNDASPPRQTHPRRFLPLALPPTPAHPFPSPSDLPQLHEWISEHKSTACWPVDEFIAAITDEYAGLARFVFPAELSKMSPALDPDSADPRSLRQLDDPGFFGASARPARLQLGKPAALLAKCVDYAISLARHRRTDPEALVRIVAQHRGHDDPRSKQPPLPPGRARAVLEGAVVDLIRHIVLEDQTYLDLPESESRFLWHNAADLFFALAEQRLISAPRCLRAAMEALTGEESERLGLRPGTPNNRVIWFVLQQALADRAMLIADHQASRATPGRRSIIEMAAQFHKPTKSTTPPAKAQAIADPPRLGDRALACLITRLQQTPPQTDASGGGAGTAQLCPDTDGDALQEELGWLAQLRQAEATERAPSGRPLQGIKVDAVQGQLSVERLTNWVLLGSAFNSHEYARALFVQQCGIVSGQAVGAVPHVQPVSVAGIDAMPIWLKLRYKKLLFAQLDHYAQQRVTMLPSAASIETLARIERSMPHTAAISLLNTVEEIARHLEPTVFSKHMQDRRGAQVVHCLLELAGDRLVDTFSNASKLRLLGLMIACLGLIKGRRVYTTMSNVVRKFLAAVTDPDSLLQAALEWTGSAGANASINRLVVKAVARAIRLRAPAPVGKEGAGAGPLGRWLQAGRALLGRIQASTPLCWSPSVRAGFPLFMRQFYEALPLVAAQSFDPVTTEAKNAFGDALFNPSPPGGAVADAVAHFSAKPNQHVFLPVLLFHLGTKKIVRQKVVAVLDSFPPAELTGYTTYMLNYIVFALQGAKAQGAFDAYKKFFLDALLSLIWDHKFFSFDEILMLLVRGESTEAHKIEMELTVLAELLANPKLKEQVDDFTAKVTVPLCSCPTNYHLELTRHLKTSLDHAGAELAQLYDCMPTRIIPVLDQAVARLLEVAAQAQTPVVPGAPAPPMTVKQVEELVTKMMHQFAALFRHHPAPKVALHKLLCRFAGPSAMQGVPALLATNISLKIRLATLYGQPTPAPCVAPAPAVPAGTTPTTADAPAAEPPVWPPAYIGQCLDRIVVACDSPYPKDCRHTEGASLPTQVVMGIATEIMLQSPPLAGWAAVAVETVLGAPSVGRINALAHLFRMLPVDHEPVVDRLSALLSSEPTLQTDAFEYQLDADVDDMLSLSGQSKPRAAAALVHAMGYRDTSRALFPGDVLALVQGQFAAPATPKSLQQIKFVCHLVGPFISTIRPAELDAAGQVITSLAAATLQLLGNAGAPPSAAEKLLAARKSAREVASFLGYAGQLLFEHDGQSSELDELRRRSIELGITFVPTSFPGSS